MDAISTSPPDTDAEDTGPFVSMSEDYYTVKLLALRTGAACIPHPDKVRQLLS
jgi:hypothetical protein